MKALADKIVIVTGASSGIGRATALLFAREGARLVVTARRRPELDGLLAEIERAGGEAVSVAGDVKDEALAKSWSIPPPTGSAGLTSPLTTRDRTARWSRFRTCPSPNGAIRSTPT